MPTVPTWSMRRWLLMAHSSDVQMLSERRAAGGGGAARAGEARRAAQKSAAARARARPRGRAAFLKAVFMVHVLGAIPLSKARIVASPGPRTQRGGVSG